MSLKNRLQRLEGNGAYATVEDLIAVVDAEARGDTSAKLTKPLHPQLIAALGDFPPLQNAGEER